MAKHEKTFPTDNEEDGFESLDDLEPVSNAAEEDAAAISVPDEVSAESETTPIPDRIDAEELDDLDALADTVPMEPRPKVTAPIIVPMASGLNEDGDTRSIDSNLAEATSRGDAVPVPVMSPIAKAVSDKKQDESKDPGNGKSGKQDSEPEEQMKVQSNEKPSLSKSPAPDKPTKKDRVDVDVDNDEEEEEEGEDSESENPISASMREASAAKKRAEENKDGPIFIVDPVSDQWIAEDLAELSGVGPGGKKRKANLRRGKRKSGFWQKVAMLFFVCFLLVVGLGVAAWFTRDRIIAKGETLAIGKLDEEGIFLSYEERSFQFPRGLVLSDVTIFAEKERETQVLKVGNFAIDLDVWHLLSTRTADGIEAAITMEDATAVAFHEGEAVCEITGLNADLFATTERLKINRLKGTLKGLDFDVEGLVNLPEPQEAGGEGDVAAEGTATDSAEEKPVLDFAFLKEALEPISFERAEKGKNPLLQVTVDLTTDLLFYADGSFSGRDFKWQGIPLDHAGVTFNYSQKLNVIDVVDSRIGFKGGTISAKTQVMLGQNKLENLAFNSNADLIALAAYFNPELETSLGGIEFLDNPVLEANGSVNFEDFGASNLTVDYQHWKGLSVPVGEKKFTISGLNGQIEVRDGQLRTTPTSRLRADLLDGTVEIKGRITPGEKPMVFAGTMAAGGISVEKLAGLGEKNLADLNGLLSADFRGEYSLDDPKKINGSGDIQIDDGKLYSVPVIGPIQKLLATVIPVFGNRERSALKAHFDVMTGIFITNDLEIRSDGTKVRVGGKYNLSDQTTAFKAKASLDGPLGLATGLASEVLVVEGSGKISEPELKLAGVPEGLSDLVGEGLNAIEGIGNALSGEDNKPAPVVDPDGDSTTPEEAPSTLVPPVVPRVELPAAEDTPPAANTDIPRPPVSAPAPAPAPAPVLPE